MKSWMLVLIVVLIALTGIAVVAENGTKYAGVNNCKMCHSDEYKDWSQTAHSKGFELLVDVGQDKNSECLPCHSTGYGKGGFVDAETTPDLEGTVCEACHGPGADHNGDKTKITRVPSAKVCAACHQKENIHSIPSN